MILIADSGSTKTDWRLIDEQRHIHQFKTSGFNPYFQTTEEIAESIKNELLSQSPFVDNTQFEISIFYYGAGCSNEEKCKMLEMALPANFPAAKVEVYHDLLAAARALCGRNEGIAAILGTGSNSCYYDG